MDRPEIGLQSGLLWLPRSPIKGFLSGCKLLTWCAYTSAPASSYLPLSSRHTWPAWQLSTEQICHGSFQWDDFGQFPWVWFLLLAHADIPLPWMDHWWSLHNWSQCGRKTIFLLLACFERPGWLVVNVLPFGNAWIHLVGSLVASYALWIRPICPSFCTCVLDICICVFVYLDPSGWMVGC